MKATTLSAHKARVEIIIFHFSVSLTKIIVYYAISFFFFSFYSPTFFTFTTLQILFMRSKLCHYTALVLR